MRNETSVTVAGQVRRVAGALRIEEPSILVPAMFSLERRRLSPLLPPTMLLHLENCPRSRPEN